MQSGLAMAVRSSADTWSTGKLVGECAPEDVVRAAGGIIVRRAAWGPDEVAVVHRPRRVDWSFPKGKLEPGESYEEAARREVLEETGLACQLGSFVGRAWYRDRKDRRKVVAYWLMHPERGGFQPNDEVDELRWLAPPEAADLLTYDRDRQLLAAVAGWLSPQPSAPAVR